MAKHALAIRELELHKATIQAQITQIERDARAFGELAPDEPVTSLRYKSGEYAVARLLSAKAEVLLAIAMLRVDRR